LQSRRDAGAALQLIRCLVEQLVAWCSAISDSSRLRVECGWWRRNCCLLRPLPSRDAEQRECYQQCEVGQSFLHLPGLTVLPKKRPLRGRPIVFGSTIVPRSCGATAGTAAGRRCARTLASRTSGGL